VTSLREREIVRVVHLVLSIPIVGYLYGPVEHIARAAFFVRWVAFPLVVLSGFWLWLKPRLARRMIQYHMRRSELGRIAPSVF
jgi:hypothetical protein